MKRYTYIISVRGVLPFPIDMLRRDRCTPRTEIDSFVISHTISDSREPATTVELVSDGRNAHWGPTVGRWESFGWTVISSIRKEER